MKDTDYVWGAAAVVILIGIYTHTSFIQNFVRKVKNQQGFYYADPQFDYRNTESIPRVSQDQLEEMYPEGVKPHPNQHLCTGDCKSGTCDSQGFCIDSGCGSVIRGGSQCKKHKKQTKTKEKSHRNTIPPITVSALPDIEIPALNQYYNQPAQVAPSSDQDLTSPSTPSTDVSDEPFDSIGNQLQQIQPNIPATSPTPIQQAPTGGQLSSLSFTPDSGTYTQKCNHNNKIQINQYGCYPGCVSEGIRDTCRTQADLTPLYGGDYMVDATVGLGGPSKMPGGKGNNPYTEITSGGPGSFHGACCGFTLGVRNNDGFVHMESEDWTHGGTTGQVYCDDHSGNPAPCTESRASVSGGKPLYGQSVRIQWVKQGGRYGGIVTGPSGSTGLVWAPGNPQIGVISGNIAKDSSRVRTDAAGMNVSFNAKVYTLGGYDEDEWYGYGW